MHPGQIGNDNSTLYGQNRNNTSRATPDSLLSQGSLWSRGVLKANIPLPRAFRNNAINAFQTNVSAPLAPTNQPPHIAAPHDRLTKSTLARINKNKMSNRRAKAIKSALCLINRHVVPHHVQNPNVVKSRDRKAKTSLPQFGESCS